jgi:hypothetical protein
MNKKIKHFLIFVLILAFFVAPSFSFSAGLVPECGQVKIDGKEMCIWGWNELLGLINNIINFIFTKMILPIAAIMFTYAGFKVVGSGGDEESYKKGKEIFMNVVIGLVIALSAWLIVHTILFLVGFDDSWFLSKFKLK